MRLFLAFLLLGACLCVVTAEDQAVAAAAITESVSEIVKTDAQTMVDLLNPSQRVDIRDTNMLWGDPVSTIGQKIQGVTWLATFIFLPFLFIPQILLIYVIVKFRDSKGKRKSATFVGHHVLEFWWTVIPIIVLVIVTFPVVDLLYEQEMPPAAVGMGEAMEVRVTGKKFNWVYDYPDQDISGLNTFLMEFSPEIEGTKDPITVVMQEPAVFEKGRVTTLFFSSLDVTHAWGVPALAVKKDCFVDRVNHSWFDSSTTGFFEGQCYELCGAEHAYMLITAAVVEPEQFKQWVHFMKHRSAANSVVAALRSGEAVADAVKTYLKDDASDVRKAAVRYWLKYEYLAKAEYLEQNKKFIKDAWIDTAIKKTTDFLSSKESELNNLMRPYKAQIPMKPLPAVLAVVPTMEGAQK